jgi:ATP-dependent DNA ligase
LITIEYGQLNGAMQQQIDHIKTNNSGRNLKEQIILEMKSRISRQRAKGYRDTIEEARRFVNKNELNLHKPMLAQRFDKVAPFDYTKVMRQYKYDGHRCLITKQNGELIAYSRNGKIIDTIEHITMHLDIEEGMTLDGELYCHGHPLQTIASWVKRKQEDTRLLSYVVYDLVSVSNYLPYSDRYKWLKTLNLGPQTVIAPTWITDVSVKTELEEAVAAGYEGLMLRLNANYEPGKRSKSLIKVKKVLDDEFQVIDIRPSRDGWGVLTCRVGDTTFDVSAPGTMENKKHILDNKQDYIGKWIRVEYFSETNEGKPFHPVATYWRNKEDE